MPSSSFMGWERSIPARAATMPSDRTSFCIAGAMRRSANIKRSCASSLGSISIIFVPRHLSEISQVGHNVLVRFRRKRAQLRHDGVIEPLMVRASLRTVGDFDRQRKFGKERAADRWYPVGRLASVPAPEPILRQRPDGKDGRSHSPCALLVRFLGPDLHDSALYRLDVTYEPLHLAGKLRHF